MAAHKSFSFFLGFCATCLLYLSILCLPLALEKRTQHNKQITANTTMTPQQKDEDELSVCVALSLVARAPIAVLKAAVKTMRHHKRGWLQEDLCAKLFSDFQAQQIHIRAQKDILGDEFYPLHIMPGRDHEGGFSFTKNVDVPKNYLGSCSTKKTARKKK
jgi:hypothetical protein